MSPHQRIDEHAHVFAISVAAELAGMHPQTLRQYDRIGLVVPVRTRGRGRRYSARDVAKLRIVQRLSQDEGINLAGIRRILELEDELDAVRAQLDAVQSELERVTAERRRVFAADRDGRISALRRGERPRREPGALVLWRPPWRHQP
ncbi:heat shock protein transcriptional repressor HspR [Brachybacterium timonense]|uniref:heat shock protein transcriptional repressor HspR n=1 Tax=Brachybacterium timonense TaxID=2050896 RepID=UPI000D0B34BE|nr:helix-turn-helix transcriptional regulator [Brachybacterium timonense]